MVDLETTGTRPEHTAIIQIAAVRFNLETKEIDHNFFNRALAVPPHRFWDEGTRDWWLDADRVPILAELTERAEPPEQVMRDFRDWLVGVLPINELKLWAKPTSFEWPFIASYARDYGLALPVHYRNAVDLNSYIRGRGHWNLREFWDAIPFEGPAHNAIFDVLHQIKGAFAA